MGAGARPAEGSASGRSAAGADPGPAGVVERPRVCRPPGRPTVKDVAALAEVSRSAASRALSGSGYVGQEARRRVLAAAAELGYVPHATARHLKDRVSACVGVLTLDVRRAEEAAVVAGVCAAAREGGLATMVADLAGRSLDALEALRDFVAFGVAGTVLCPVSAEPVGYLARYGVPTVEVGHRFAPGRSDAVVVPPGAVLGQGGARDLGVTPEEAARMGRQAVGLLLRRIEEPGRPVEVIGRPRRGWAAQGAREHGTGSSGHGPE